MTRFVLHGGFSKEKAPLQEDDEFFGEILKDAPEKVKILLVYFAEREDMIELRIGQDMEQFNENKKGKDLSFRVASEETFLEDCAWADVIYLHGGRTVRLMDVLRKYENLEQAFQDKTIAADSAGVNALGRFFFGKSSRQVGRGLGILQFKTVVHYRDGEPNPLADIEPDVETLFLREYETKVLTN